MKWFIGLLLTSIVFISLLVSVLLWVPLDKFKPQIEQAVFQTTGRSLSLIGKIRLSWFPSIGLELGATRLGNAPGFSETPFAELNQAVLRIALVPLLRGQIEVEALQIDGLALNLEKNKHGKTNWQDLLTQTERGAPSAVQTSQPLELALSGIDIQNAVLNWHDLSSDSTLSLSPIALRTGVLKVGKPVDLELGLIINNKTPELKTDIKLRTRVHFDQQWEHIKFKNINLSFSKLEGSELALQTMQGLIKADISTDLKDQSVTLHSLHGIMSGTHPDGSQLGAHLTTQGFMDLAAGKYLLEDIEVALTAKDTPLTNKEIRGILKTSLEINMKTQTLTMKPIRFEGMGLQLIGDLKTDKFLETPVIQGSIKLKPFSPRKVLTSLGQSIPKTLPNESLQAAALSADFESTLKGLVLPRIFIALDQIKIIGKLGIENFDQPRIVLLMNADTVDIDPYLGLINNEDIKASVEKSAAHKETPLFRTETLRELNLKGLLEIDALKLGGVKTTKLRATFDSANGHLQVKPLSLSLYEGQLSGSAKVNVHKSEPHVTTYLKATDVKIGALLRDALGKEAATVEGRTALKLDILTRGNHISTLKKQLKGSIDVKVVQGKLRNKKFAEKLEKLTAILQSRQPRHPDDTVLFDSFSATWIPKEGILFNEDLRLSTELIQFQGEGNIDLLQETVNYSLFPIFYGKDQNILLAPITVAGPFDDLQYGLDVTRFSRRQLKRSTENLREGLQTHSERLKSGVKETTEDIKQKLQDGLEAIKRTFKFP